MTRLIDADALMKIVDAEVDRVEEMMRDAEERPNLYTDEFRTYNSYVASGMAHIAQDILEAPTIDAVPVVRCKDCLWYAPFDDCKPYACEFSGMSPVYGNDFCSFGERKDDE